MSLENLKKYTEHCLADDDAKARAKSIGHNDLDGHIAHAKEHGLEFSEEHMTEMRDELVASGALTEEQLENAAGGTPLVVALAVAGDAAVVGAVAGAATTSGHGW